MVDLPSVPSEEDNDLQQLLEKFLEAKEDELSQADRKTKFVDGFVTVLTGTDEGRPIYKVKEEIDLHQLPLIVGEFPGDEGNHLLEFIQDEYNEELPSTCLKRLYVDAFGRNGEDLDNWSHKLPDLEQKLLADIHGLSKQRTINLLCGVGCPEGDIDIGNNIRLIHPETNEIYARSQMADAGGRPPSIDSDGILEIETTQRKQDRDLVRRSAAQRQLALATLRLYGATPVDTIVNHRIPITYRPSDMVSYSGEISSRGSSYSITPDETQNVAKLFTLLSTFFDEDRRRFTPPIEIALDHFETSVSTRTSYHSSITFGIIGLESLYKHYVEGSNSSSDVQRYAAFTLDQTVPHLDVFTIRDDLETAYDTRNDLVHGETLPDDEDETLQQRVWDYLRYSIIIFAKLWTTENEDSPLPIERALLNDTTRNEFTSHLDQIEVTDYLAMTND